MKRIIITGKSGYIANRLRAWLAEKDEPLAVELLDLRDPNWKAVSLVGADAVVHTAALVHRDEKRIPQAEYERVNAALTKELAERMRACGVPYMIFISTMAVYGAEPSLFRKTTIDETTACRPATKYGVSKLHAEEILIGMQSDAFDVAIVRPPVIYGAGCPGNYRLLRGVTLRLGVVPKIPNEKSMLFIDNLCQFLWRLLQAPRSGVFMPQNAEPVRTWALCESIARHNGKRLRCLRLLNPLVYLGSIFLPPLRKAFGTEVYDRKISVMDFNYQICDFEESIRRTEKPGEMG